MGSPTTRSRGYVAAAVAALSFALLLPANAQFWEPWGGRQQQQRQPSRDSWGGGGGFWQPFESRPYRERDIQREAPVDHSRAPAPTQKKPDATTNIVVMGDAMADWLAVGLEEAFSEKPEIGIVRKHRTESGLIRYDTRRDVEWAQIAREIIAADKPKFIVMMIGNNDRQTIRERAPPHRRRRPRKPIPSSRPPRARLSRRRRPSRFVLARSAHGNSTPRSGKRRISGASTPPWRR
jgi:uncharacterized protein